jgi:hypothetical protein
MKLCKDCKWFPPFPPGSPLDDQRFARCWHELARRVPSIDVVVGLSASPSHQMCSTMRFEWEPCGQDARLYEVRDASPD